MSRQLHLADPTCLPRYLERPRTHYEHAQEIKRHYGYHDFHAQPEYFRFVRWLYTRAWLSAERPSVLFDFATARLVERKVLLPGVTVLARLVARIRDRAASQLWHRLAQLPNAEQQAKLEALVEVPDGARSSPLDQLRRAPVRVSGPALLEALATRRGHPRPRRGGAVSRSPAPEPSPGLSPLWRGRTRASHRPDGSRTAPCHPAGLCTRLRVHRDG